MITELVHQKTCKKNRVVTDINTGEIACMNCGAVLSERVVDSRPENLGMSGEEYQANSRVGRKISLKMIDMGSRAQASRRSLEVDCTALE